MSGSGVAPGRLMAQSAFATTSSRGDSDVYACLFPCIGGLVGPQVLAEDFHKGMAARLAEVFRRRETVVGQPERHTTVFLSLRARRAHSSQHGNSAERSSELRSSSSRLCHSRERHG